jgi:hypothetical protein
MSKQILFSAFMVAAFLVAPIASASTLSISSPKVARADNLSSSMSSISSDLLSSLFSSSSNLQSSSTISLSSLSQMFSSSLISSSSSLSSVLNVSSSSSSSLTTKKVKSFAQADVKPVKLDPAGLTWWKEIDTVSGGNGDISGVDEMNTLLQTKLQSMCPNIYDTATKTINEANLTNCAPINNLPIQKVGVIDSGVSATQEMIPFMDQANSWNYFTSINNPICTATSNLLFAQAQGAVAGSTVYYCKEKGTQSDTDYHGTAATYVTIQMFKGSLLKNKIKVVPVSLRTLDTINISDSIDQLTADGIKVINLSLGTPYNIAYLETSINDASAAGVTLYASSGNCATYTASNCEYDGLPGQTIPQEANNAPNYPAAYANATMVGSTNYSDNNITGVIRASYSNYPTALRTKFVSAPVGNNGIVLPCFYQCPIGVTSYGYLGTSFAAPQASGLNILVNRFTTLMSQNLGYVNEKVLTNALTPEFYINGNTTDLLTPGNDLETGNGLINVKKISNAITAQITTVNVPVSSSSLVVPSSSLIVPSSSVVSSSSLIVPSSVIMASSSIVTPPNTMINTIGLSSDNLNYVVTSTSNFVPAFGGDHIHFYYNTEANTVMNKMFAGTGPYSIALSTKPAGATQLCTIVGTATHGIVPNTGNCVNLPIPNSLPVPSGFTNNSSAVYNICQGVTSSFNMYFTDVDNNFMVVGGTPALPAGMSYSTTSVAGLLTYIITPGIASVSNLGSISGNFSLTAREEANVSNPTPILVTAPVSFNIINCNPPTSSAQVVTPISSAILVSSSNVSSTTNTNTVSSSSISSSIPSSSQISSSSQAISSSSTTISSPSSSVSSQSSTVVTNPSNSGGGSVITIISNIIGNLINSLTGNNANTNGNLNSNSSSSSASSNVSQSPSIQDEKIKIPATTVPLKNSEDAAFVGLVNNPNGSTNPSEFGIKEQGIKSPIITIETQSGISTNPTVDTEKGIKDQGIKGCGNCGVTGGKLANSNSSIASSQSVIPSCKKSINQKGMKLYDETVLDCSTQPECKKDWDGSIKGGINVNSGSELECNPLEVSPQSDVYAWNGLGKYIPILIVAIISVIGLIFGFNYFHKIPDAK